MTETTVRQSWVSCEACGAAIPYQCAYVNSDDIVACWPTCRADVAVKEVNREV